MTSRLMGHAVFTTRVVPSYDDLPEKHYHFPRTYLRQVEAAVGDVIVYYEPRRTGDPGGGRGRQAYFATAVVDRIADDPERPDHFYAYVRDYSSSSNPCLSRRTATTTSPS